MTERDVLRRGHQLVTDRIPALGHAHDLVAKARDEVRCAEVVRQQPRMFRSECPIAGDAVAQLLRRAWRPLADAQAIELEWKLHADVARQPSCPVGGGQPRHSRENGAVVFDRLGQFLVTAFLVLRLDTAPAEADALGDQDAGAAHGRVVGERTGRHGDREVRRPRQQRKAHLALHLRAPKIADGIVEVARELHEQFAWRAGLGTRIVDRQQQLAPGTAAAHVVAARDRGDAIVRRQRTGGVHHAGQKVRSAFTQRSRIGGNRDAEGVAAGPDRRHHRRIGRRILRIGVFRSARRRVSVDDLKRHCPSCFS